MEYQELIEWVREINSAYNLQYWAKEVSSFAGYAAMGFGVLATIKRTLFGKKDDILATLLDVLRNRKQHKIAWDAGQGKLYAGSLFFQVDAHKDTFGVFAGSEDLWPKLTPKEKRKVEKEVKKQIKLAAARKNVLEREQLMVVLKTRGDAV